ncbi:MULTISPECIES: hypothetical protein [Pseudomonas]|uniref:hypothetical protein n=1 Tax=Pseudomonas TaxID=286 RepID=UPI0002A1589F|nr:MULTISPECIES: hypothetical protein [Pseudomonas]AGA72649.1 hypothetical protein B479_08685 [Pseudomonas putida HB3267]MCE0757185.1 hypothetical protein [Pseudomonas asiatica]MCE0946433.1 hypothetical protein [Pseudomonas asiatica]MCE0955996.1 hypothetical protein [Pseudomonas asiatica]MCE1031041.1 hypothetical protein [Pseudomonas asiatica]
MKVIALERGYYGGKIQDPPEAGGQPFDILSEAHLGKWMQPQGWKPSGKAQASTTASTGSQTKQSLGYAAKFNGGTRWRVIDAKGEWFSDFIGSSKEEAQAEADRLNAGGEPYIKPEDTTSTTTTTTSTGSQDGGTGDDGSDADDDDGPDA